MSHQKRIPVGMLAFALAAFVFLAIAPDVRAGHAVEITSGAADAGSYTMKVDVSGFKLVEVGSTDQNTKGEGHIHYLLNGKPADGAYATTATSFTYEGLKEGDVLTVELVNNDHSSTDPKATSSLTVGAMGEASAATIPVLIGTGLLALAFVAARRRA